jgi:hypothetical protein
MNLKTHIEEVLLFAARKSDEAKDQIKSAESEPWRQFWIDRYNLIEQTILWLEGELHEIETEK